jgi:hypothetical protein
MQRSILLSSLFIMCLIFVACNQESLLALPASTDELTVSPLAVSVMPTPIPAPTLDLTGLEPVEGLGTVVGALEVRRGAAYVPVPDVKLGIGTTLLDDQGNVRMVGYDASVDPTTTTDEYGRFVFTDVPPGQYGLILDIVISSFLLSHETSGMSIIFDVEANQIYDVATLRYDSLPIAGFHEE